jgi:RNA ligase
LYPHITYPEPRTVRVDYAIATRGSFHSEQAEWATKFLNNSDAFLEIENGFWPQPDKTYLFEIIYPENRIVVDYGDYRGLVLIDVIDNLTGVSDTDEFDDCEWPDKVKRIPLAGFDSGQVVDIAPGEEGFVYLWPTRNYRTKMKSAEYVEIHRMVSNLSEKTIWQALVASKTLDQIKQGLPEEFHGYIDDKGKPMLDSARYLMGESHALYNEVKDLPSRKAAAVAIKDSPLKGYVFKLLDGKEIWLDCIKAQRPGTDNPLIKEV